LDLAGGDAAFDFGLDFRRRRRGGQFIQSGHAQIRNSYGFAAVRRPAFPRKLRLHCPNVWNRYGICTIMQCVRPNFSASRATTRSRISNRSRMLPGVDGRSSTARRFRDICANYEAEFGGNISELERDLNRANSN